MQVTPEVRTVLSRVWNLQMALPHRLTAAQNTTLFWLREQHLDSALFELTDAEWAVVQAADEILLREFERMRRVLEKGMRDMAQAMLAFARQLEEALRTNAEARAALAKAMKERT